MTDPVASLGVPDWVMLGAPDRDGVVIYASNELGVTELRAIVSRRPLRGDDRVCARPPAIDHMVLSAAMKTYVWVRGRTYEEALRTLLLQWQPQRPDRPAVDSQPSLPPG